MKKYFLLANAGKGFFKIEKIGRNGLEDMYHAKLKELDEMDENDFDSRFKDKVRLKRYNEMEWTRSEALLEEMGSWPKMGSLPIEFTLENIPEVAKMVKLYRQGEVNVRNENKEKTEKRAAKLESMVQYVDFVRPNFPLILFPGGEVRENDYNIHARENNLPLVKIFRYDIDDGNNRAVSYVLAGLKDAPVFIGKRD